MLQNVTNVLPSHHPCQAGIPVALGTIWYDPGELSSGSLPFPGYGVLGPDRPGGLSVGARVPGRYLTPTAVPRVPGMDIGSAPAAYRAGSPPTPWFGTVSPKEKLPVAVVVTPKPPANMKVEADPLNKGRYVLKQASTGRVISVNVSKEFVIALGLKLPAKEKGMDLGQIFVDVGSQYIKTKWGTPSPPSLAPQLPPMPGTTLPSTPAFLDIPGIDIVGDPGDLVAKAARIGGKLIYDYVTGKWKIQRRRRRRRRLATTSDIKDLAALKQILGSGASFTTWIATRGR